MDTNITPTAVANVSTGGLYTSLGVCRVRVAFSPVILEVIVYRTGVACALISNRTVRLCSEYINTETTIPQIKFYLKFASPHIGHSQA